MPFKRAVKLTTQMRFMGTGKYPGESTFALIKPDGMEHLGEIFDTIHAEGFYIRALRMSQFSKASAKAFYEDHVGKDYFPAFADFVSSGPVVGMRLGRLDAVAHWRTVMGPRDPEEAKRVAPTSLRARFATDGRVNTVHGADSEQAKTRELDFFFGSGTLMTRLPPVYPNTILELAPKHIQDGLLGKIVRDIRSAGCRINAMQMFTIEELMDLHRKLGEDAPKVIRRKVKSGNTLFLDVSHKKGYDKLVEEMLKIENIYDTGFTHFDRGEEQISDKVFV